MKAATIQVIKMILLSNLFFSFQLSAMQEMVVPSDNLFEQLPSNVTYAILTHGHYSYPWKNITHACGLKAVCKDWNTALSTTTVAETLNIPEMHLAVMKDDIEEIIKLKLEGHSILEPDYCGFNPSHYAIAYNKENAIKMLHIGNGIIYFKEEHAEYVAKNEIIQESIKELTSRKNRIPLLYNQKTAQEDNLTHVMNMLIGNNPHLSYILLDELYNNPHIKPDTIQTNKTGKLILYALQNALENTLHYHANVEESHTKQRIKNYFTNDLIDDFFESFVRNGANPNAYQKCGLTPLIGLCHIEKKDYFPIIMKLLALPTIDVNLHGKLPTMLSECGPIHLAALHGRFDILMALLKNNQSNTKCDINRINKHGFSPLYFGVQNGHYDCVEELIKHGADASIIVKDNANLLHIAATKGYAKILDILIPLLKNNINHKSCNGLTPLVYCVASKSENTDLCVRLLINAGADPNIATNNGLVAMHYAQGNNLTEIAKILLDKGANVNARILHKTPTDGTLLKSLHHDAYTLLHGAANNGHCDFIKLLLEHGADATLKTTAGATALDVAREYRNIELAKDNVPSIEEHEEKLAQYEEAIKLLL